MNHSHLSSTTSFFFAVEECWDAWLWSSLLSEGQLHHAWCSRLRELSPHCKLCQSVWKDEGVLCGIDTETEAQAFQQVLHQQGRTASGLPVNSHTFSAVRGLYRGKKMAIDHVLYTLSCFSPCKWMLIRRNQGRGSFDSTTGIRKWWMVRG